MGCAGIPGSGHAGYGLPTDDPLSQKRSSRWMISSVCHCFVRTKPEINLPARAGERMPEPQLEGSFRLSCNGSMFAKESPGYLLTFDYLIDPFADSGLVFCPLSPRLETELYLSWKKHQIFPPIAERLLRKRGSDTPASFSLLSRKGLFNSDWRSAPLPDPLPPYGSHHAGQGRDSASACRSAPVFHP